MMGCARQRRLETEAHDEARFNCLDAAERLGLSMSCADEDRCGAPGSCNFFKDAFAEITAFDGMLP